MLERSTSVHLKGGVLDYVGEANGEEDRNGVHSPGFLAAAAKSAAPVNLLAAEELVWGCGPHTTAWQR